jgi:hypothetical protein
MTRSKFTLFLGSFSGSISAKEIEEHYEQQFPGKVHSVYYDKGGKYAKVTFRQEGLVDDILKATAWENISGIKVHLEPSILKVEHEERIRRMIENVTPRFVFNIFYFF